MFNENAVNHSGTVNAILLPSNYVGHVSREVLRPVVFMK
jgi:hypothetical protein